MEQVSSRQKEILECLLLHKDGLSIDELADSLGISRPAIKQHFGGLEAEGYIEKKSLEKTAGRPVARYGITNKGIHLFPKQYAWFASLMFEDLLEMVSVENGEIYMTKLGKKLASQLHQFHGKSLQQRVQQLLLEMNELGFVVEEVKNPIDAPICFRANNCIYHDLAKKYPQICQFDLALIKSTLNTENVELSKSMARGDNVCEFLISAE